MNRSLPALRRAALDKPVSLAAVAALDDTETKLATPYVLRVPDLDLVNTAIVQSEELNKVNITKVLVPSNGCSSLFSSISVVTSSASSSFVSSTSAIASAASSSPASSSSTMLPSASGLLLFSSRSRDTSVRQTGWRPYSNTRADVPPLTRSWPFLTPTRRF